MTDLIWVTEFSDLFNNHSISLQKEAMVQSSRVKLLCLKYSYLFCYCSCSESFKKMLVTECKVVGWRANRQLCVSFGCSSDAQHSRQAVQGAYYGTTTVYWLLASTVALKQFMLFSSQRKSTVFQRDFEAWGYVRWGVGLTNLDIFFWKWLCGLILLACQDPLVSGSWEGCKKLLGRRVDYFTLFSWSQCRRDIVIS